LGSIQVSSSLIMQSFPKENDKEAEFVISLYNSSNSVESALIYTEKDTNRFSANSFLDALPDTIVVQAQSTQTYRINANINNSLLPGSYSSKVYVEDINAQYERIGQHLVKTNVRYEILCIINYKFEPKLLIDIKDVNFSNESMNVTFSNQSNFISDLSVEVQYFNENGEILNNQFANLIILPNQHKSKEFSLDKKDYNNIYIIVNDDYENSLIFEHNFKGRKK
ncbi:MAG TPA: hypothetical protein PK816_15740, partial [Candidatus Cloacimonadota bacterium]|nr:hypothetical protein [Candidatus Cloacimonadota bacterium]